MARQRTGTMRQRKSGVWELAASIKKLQGVTAGAERIQAFVDGLPQAKAQAKQERRYETFEGTKAEAAERLRAMQVEADKGDLPRSNITVGEWLAHWLRTYVADHLAENTLRTYTWLVDEHIEPRIGTMKLDKVRTVDIEALLADVRKEIPGSFHLAHQAMNGAFQRAVKLEMLQVNPVRNADKPKSGEKEIIPPRRTEVEAFLEAAKGHPYYALYFTLANTGLRIGEALGLRWENVELRETGSILHVRKQLTNPGAGLKLVSLLKSKKARRSIPLTGETVKVLFWRPTRWQRRLSVALRAIWSLFSRTPGPANSCMAPKSGGTYCHCGRQRASQDSGSMTSGTTSRLRRCGAGLT